MSEGYEMAPTCRPRIVGKNAMRQCGITAAARYTAVRAKLPSAGANPRDAIWSEVYWWDVGALPGQAGNAVIAGHVNRPDASPSAFTRLNGLAPGDRLEVATAGDFDRRLVIHGTLVGPSPLDSGGGVAVHG